jgi:23S rRNA pseudouridine955/2504/2580 synthase
MSQIIKQLDPPKAQIVSVPEDYSGQRIDNFLITHLKGVPKTRIYRMIRKGEVRINGGRAKPESRINDGDAIRIPPVRMTSQGPEGNFEFLEIEKTIIYEDKHMLIINKPAGMAVHGGSGLSFGAIEALRSARPKQAFLELAHRLDRATSGCLLVAKKRAFLKKIQLELHGKSRLRKYYDVFVHGTWPSAVKEVTVPLMKNTLQSGERISRVSMDGKDCKTKFSIISHGDGISWLRAQPITGRTHQIRVHCAHQGYPVIGDNKYGNPVRDKALKVPRMMLHASSLGLKAITGEQKEANNLESFWVEADQDTGMAKFAKRHFD